jgi:hypothetical protein
LCARDIREPAASFQKKSSGDFPEEKFRKYLFKSPNADARLPDRDREKKGVNNKPLQYSEQQVFKKNRPVRRHVIKKIIF